MAWACSPLGVLIRPLLDSISAASIPTLSEYTLQNLSNTAWAFAKLQMLDEPLRSAISAEARPKIYDAPCQDLVNTASAFASRAIMDEELSDAISEEAQRRINDFDLVQKRRLEEIFLGTGGDCDDWDADGEAREPGDG